MYVYSIFHGMSVRCDVNKIFIFVFVLFFFGHLKTINDKLMNYFITSSCKSDQLWIKSKKTFLRKISKESNFLRILYTHIERKTVLFISFRTISMYISCYLLWPFAYHYRFCSHRERERKIIRKKSSIFIRLRVESHE